MSQHIVTTTVLEVATGKDLPPVSLDNRGVTRDLEDARRLRNAYVVTLTCAGAVGAPAYVWPDPVDREGFVVEHRNSRGEVVTRETVTVKEV